MSCDCILAYTGVYWFFRANNVWQLCCKLIQWRWNEFESGGGGTGPEQKWGAPIRRFFGRSPPLFGSKSTISGNSADKLRMPRSAAYSAAE